jgi:pyruvate dehydrogenase E2 component (dihydrolipoamide acetyltransferase)
MAEIKEARVPDIGDYSDVPVIEVLVAVGDTVTRDQGLVTLESDKATLEVPAPFAGVIKELKVKLGDTLSEGSVVALIEVADGAAAPAAAPAAPAKAEAAPAPVKTAETGAKVEPVAPAAQPDKLAQREIAQVESLPAKGGNDPEADPPRTPPVEFGAASVLPDQVPYASPAVRLFARELGVDLFQVKGSERGGRITKEDVQRFV